MMMHSARRRRIQLFDRGVRSPRYKDPVISRAKCAAIGLGCESDFDAVLQNEGCAGGRHLDDCRSARVLVPSFDSRVTLRVGQVLSIDREKAGSQCRLEGNRATRILHRIDLAHLAWLQ